MLNPFLHYLTQSLATPVVILPYHLFGKVRQREVECLVQGYIFRKSQNEGLSLHLPPSFYPMT